MSIEASFILRAAALIEEEGKYLMMQQVLDEKFYPVSTEVQANEVTQEAVERLLRDLFEGEVSDCQLALIEESMNVYPAINRQHHEICYYYHVQIANWDQFKKGIEESNYQKNPKRQFVWLDHSELDNEQIYPETFREILLNPSDTVRVYRTIPKK